MGSSNTKQNTEQQKKPATNPAARTAPTNQGKAINIAIKFLQGPEMKKIDKESKINFLQKKGLTKQQIDKAFIVVQAEQKTTKENVQIKQSK